MFYIYSYAKFKMAYHYIFWVIGKYFPILYFYTYVNAKNSQCLYFFLSLNVIFPNIKSPQYIGVFQKNPPPQEEGNINFKDGIKDGLFWTKDGFKKKYDLYEILNQNRTKTEPEPNSNRTKTEPEPNQNRTKPELEPNQNRTKTEPEPN